MNEQSPNGDPLGPSQVAALQQELQAFRIMFSARGANLFGEILNAIEIRSSQATQGDMNARREVMAMVKALEGLKAAAHGIARG